jgi:SAM-dependent methyltransferase
VTAKGSRPKERFYPESRFGGFSRVDGTIAFYSRVNALIRPESIVLDVGCGRGAYAEDRLPFRRDLRIFKGRTARVIGLDVDPAAAENPFLDEFHLLDAQTWPLPGCSVDVIVSDSVVEHLENPPVFFSEARRVLRKDGFLCIRTPNLWSYPAVVSRLIPNQAHVGVLVKVKERTKVEDVFPTHYRCNTLPALRRYLARHEFDAVVYGFGPEPAYLSFSNAAYALGVLYQRLVPGFLQPVLFAFARVQKT